MAREETLVPSLTLENKGLKIGLEWSKGGQKSWSLFSYKRQGKREFFSPLVSATIPVNQKRKTVREKRGRREKEGKKKGRKLRVFPSQGM